MTHDPKTLEALKAADPIIRNDLLLLFSAQKATDLATNDGKESCARRRSVPYARFWRQMTASLKRSMPCSLPPS